ncbi:MAG: SAM-dependent methyltransferase [Woeseiaceae bacterium]|nr:SAM-dependent methyltransferase [Woeseiaceae bacterium]
MQPGRREALPEPDAASAAHSARVLAHVRDRIRAAGGALSFASYMHEVLYAPGLGYYAAGATNFGAAGDFVTAPEISPVFGRIVARQVAAVLGSVDEPAVLEFGAGSGRLAVDVLGALAELDALPREYRILEPAADLKARQQALIGAAIPDLAGSVRWLDRLPAGHRGAIIANEVLDALPVERFRRTADGVSQFFVAEAGAGLELVERPAGAALDAAVRGIEDALGEPLPDGYVSEVCLAAPAWLADVAQLLDEGIALLFDYGVSRREYYAPERAGGWLRCHFRHRAHDDPLVLPGIQDITAWVDFTAVADAALDRGLEVAGFVTQAHFLMHGGLAEELAHFADLPTAAQLELSAQVKTLTLPGEMGERFRCLGLARGPVAVPPAFTAVDRAVSL